MTPGSRRAATDVGAVPFRLGAASTHVVTRSQEHRLAAMSLDLTDRRVAMEPSRPAVGDATRPAIRLSTATLHCTDARELARFYAELTGGAVTAFNDVWAIVTGPGGRIEFQSVADFRSPTWPSGDTPIHMHLDFLVDDLPAAVAFASTCGAARFDFQPNADHCIVMRDPAGHPFCLTTWDDVATKTTAGGEAAG